MSAALPSDNPPRRRGRRALLAYLALLLASHIVQVTAGRLYAPSSTDLRVVELAAMGDDGPIAGRMMNVAYRDWSAGPGAASRFALPEGPSEGLSGGLPVILLHGSPGRSSDFSRLGPILAESGRRVIAPDLPGFGDSSAWVPSYSVRAHAHAVLELMDSLGVNLAHVVGWSNGGAVALNLAGIERARLASLTLLAATGAQETEGSGSYFFEHVKYAVGYAGLIVLPEFIPHFGLLGERGMRHAFIRNFWDTDQRPLRRVMEGLTVPTLILHGRRDFLVSPWAAERHHEIIRHSSLVMTPHSHFMPLLQPEDTAAHIVAFIERAESGHGAPWRQTTVLSPSSSPLGSAWEGLESGVRAAPWWLELAVISVLAAWRRHVAAALAALFIARGALDLGVATAGVLAGTLAESYALWFIGRRFGRSSLAWRWVSRRVRVAPQIDWQRRLGRSPFREAFAARFKPWMRAEASFTAGLLRRAPAGRPPLALTIPAVLAGTFLSSLWVVLVPRLAAAGIVWPVAGVGAEAGLLPAVAAVLAGFWLLVRLARGCELILTWTGRRRLIAWLTRLVRYEFWPMWLFYVPALAYMARLCVRHRGFLLPSCCNPAISGGGGIVGESKAAIIAGLTHADGRVLPAAVVPDGGSPHERGLAAQRLLAQRPELGGLPVILKPDQGQRGHAVRLARTQDDVLRYFEQVRGAVVVQRYHPGPMECGVLWMRGSPPSSNGAVHAGSSPRAGSSAMTGFIYAVTRKDFPTICGDGRRTLEQLIYRHPRLRCQADTFLTRFADDRSRVLDRGETLRLAQSGNHCQGTLFRDGADLITPALEEAIDAIARGFPAASGGGGLDAGRFDMRYESDELLREGRGFAIVELNGTAGEATNLYDPDRSLAWAYRVLFGQLKALYELGAARRDAGVAPMRPTHLWRVARAHFRGRSGSSVAD